MVKLTRIYTRGGDKGETSLGDGSRVAKNHPRIELLGIVDEANAAIGLARTALPTSGTGQNPDPGDMLDRIQNELFDLGADLCRPLQGSPPTALRIIADQTARLEREIDQMNTALEPLNSFILPGGTLPAAYVHLARTVVRRAERALLGLMETEPVNPETLRYLNRLSDHLFVLARQLNAGGKGDILWVPGATRP